MDTCKRAVDQRPHRAGWFQRLGEQRARIEDAERKVEVARQASFGRRRKPRRGRRGSRDIIAERRQLDHLRGRIDAHRRHLRTPHQSLRTPHRMADGVDGEVIADVARIDVSNHGTESYGATVSRW